MNVREWLIVVGVIVFALAMGWAIQHFDRQWMEPPPQPPAVWVPPPRAQPFSLPTRGIPPIVEPYPAPNSAPSVPVTVTPDPAPRPRGPQ